MGGAEEREVNKRWGWDKKSSSRQRVVRAGGKEFSRASGGDGGCSRKQEEGARERKALLPLRLVLRWQVGRENLSQLKGGWLPEDGSSRFCCQSFRLLDFGCLVIDKMVWRRR